MVEIRISNVVGKDGDQSRKSERAIVTVDAG